MATCHFLRFCLFFEPFFRRHYRHWQLCYYYDRDTALSVRILTYPLTKTRVSGLFSQQLLSQLFIYQVLFEEMGSLPVLGLEFSVYSYSNNYPLRLTPPVLPTSEFQRNVTQFFQPTTPRFDTWITVTKQNWKQTPKWTGQFDFSEPSLHIGRHLLSF